MARMTGVLRSRGLQGKFLVVSAALTCPCHLPLVVALLAGVSVGTAIRTYWALLVAATVYFVVALVIGLRLLRKPEERAGQDGGAG